MISYDSIMADFAFFWQMLAGRLLRAHYICQVLEFTAPAGPAARVVSFSCLGVGVARRRPQTDAHVPCSVLGAPLPPLNWLFHHLLAIHEDAVDPHIRAHL